MSPVPSKLPWARPCSTDCDRDLAARSRRSSSSCVVFPFMAFSPILMCDRAGTGRYINVGYDVVGEFKTPPPGPLPVATERGKITVTDAFLVGQEGFAN